MTVDDLPLGRNARISRLVASDNATELTDRLEEIGFTLGESVAVLTRGVPGGDPMVVRVGQSRFALRRTEARCIQVALD